MQTAAAQLATLDQALTDAEVNGRWEPLTATPQASREKVDAAIGALLETLASVPDLLEVPPSAS